MTKKFLLNSNAKIYELDEPEKFLYNRPTKKFKKEVSFEIIYLAHGY